MTFWDFIKPPAVLGVILFLSAIAADAAVPSSVTVNASGRELGDAMVAAVRTAVSQNFKGYPGYSRKILDEEVIPAASQLVSSYRVLEGTDGAPTLNISAVVELSLVRNILDFSPKTVGLTEEGQEGKAVIVFRAPTISFLDRMKVTEYYGDIRKMLRERLERRHFKVIEADEDIKDAATMGDNVSEPAVLRIYGAQSETDLALGIQIEPEQSGRGGWELRGTLLQTKSGKTLGQFEYSIPSPRYKKETFLAEFQRSLMDAGNQTMMGILSRATGETVAQKREDFLHLRVVNLKNPVLLEKFRQSAAALPDIQSLLEFSVQRGSYELAVNTRLGLKQLEQKLKALTWDDMDAQIGRGVGLELTVELSPRATKSEADQEKPIEEKPQDAKE